MFGLHHCIFFDCQMNGINNLKESDARPIHLCPLDLQKLQHSVGFDVGERYRNLERFYASVGLTEEARWIENRRHTIGESSGLL